MGFVEGWTGLVQTWTDFVSAWSGIVQGWTVACSFVPVLLGGSERALAKHRASVENPADARRWVLLLSLEANLGFSKRAVFAKSPF